MRYLFIIILFVACKPNPAISNQMPQGNGLIPPLDTNYINHITDSVAAVKIVAFAKTLIGTPYRFGCTAPSTGFDCSGFITYVFNHFEIEVPRSSVDFTHAGTTIALADARAGDLILFTGTNCQTHTVGHIGLVIENSASGLSFIHASSGTDYAVIVTTLNEGYKARFVKVVRMK